MLQKIKKKQFLILSCFNWNIKSVVIEMKKEGLIMPEVQNVGTVDYAQYQPSQYQNDVYAEDYNTMPEVYDERAEEMKAANKSRMGATLLTAAIIGGLGLIGGRYWGAKGLKAEKAKAEEAIANYEKLNKATEEVEKIADENAGLFFGENRIGRNFYNKLKSLFKDARAAIKDEAKEAGEKTADDAAKAAEDAAKEA